eukprot:4150367-Pleurochrysis_carterae.AAC.1
MNTDQNESAESTAASNALTSTHLGDAQSFEKRLLPYPISCSVHKSTTLLKANVRTKLAASSSHAPQ